MAATAPRVISAQPGPQTALVSSGRIINEVLYGGARGGGKTYGLLLDFYFHNVEWGRAAAGILFREDYPEMEDLMRKASKIYPLMGGKWHATKRMWTFPEGGFLVFRYLRTEADANSYQGHEYTWIGVDEAGKYPSRAILDPLRAILRGVDAVFPRFVLTANPGGAGHNHLKSRFVDPAPPMSIMRERMPVSGKYWTRAFIPALVTDNLILLETQPEYVDQLIQATRGKPWLRRAWIYGDWDIVAGGMFDDTWGQCRRHAVLRPFHVPESWRIFRALDWGSSAPFSVGWWAESDGSEVKIGGEPRHLPRGSKIRIAEWYGWNGKPNEGVRMLASNVGRGILEREQAMGIAGRVRPGPADTSIFSTEDGHSIADQMALAGVAWERADKRPGSRKAGWELMRDMLLNTIEGERPGLYIFETCRHWIRTVPVLPRDKNDPDDVDTNAEDHIADETRYAITGPDKTAKKVRVHGV